MQIHPRNWLDQQNESEIPIRTNKNLMAARKKS